MDIKEIQRKLSDNHNYKFRRLYIYKSEIADMAAAGFSIRQIQKQLMRLHNFKISTGAIFAFLKKCEF